LAVFLYILVCLDIFSRHVKLYPLRAATTRSCLNKLTNLYFREVIKPIVILSDNGTQFQSPLWKNTMQENDVQVTQPFGIHKATHVRGS
jgi:hypothetical protein